MKMLVVVLFVGCVFSDVLSENCGVRKAFQATIVHGEAAEKGEFPWMVAFYHKLRGSFFCAGSLISEQHVLSGGFTLFFETDTEWTTCSRMYAVFIVWASFCQTSLRVTQVCSESILNVLHFFKSLTYLHFCRVIRQVCHEKWSLAETVRIFFYFLKKLIVLNHPRRFIDN